jgi:hypothetical protein
MSEDYATQIAGQVIGGVITIASVIIISYGMTKYLERKLKLLPKK